MFRSRTLNNKLNKLHERALRLVYDDRQTKLEELRNRDKLVTIHHKICRYLQYRIVQSTSQISPRHYKQYFQNKKCKLQF